uniref:Uncharacterized protein n=1 Tax=Oryza meridionalis TaxID=40149 RepID=A0A0E0DPH5_9ORYZ
MPFMPKQSCSSSSPCRYIRGGRARHAQPPCRRAELLLLLLVIPGHRLKPPSLPLLFPSPPLASTSSSSSSTRPPRGSRSSGPSPSPTPTPRTAAPPSGARWRPSSHAASRRRRWQRRRWPHRGCRPVELEARSGVLEVIATSTTHGKGDDGKHNSSGGIDGARSEEDAAERDPPLSAMVAVVAGSSPSPSPGRLRCGCRRRC